MKKTSADWRITAAADDGTIGNGESGGIEGIGEWGEEDVPEEEKEEFLSPVILEMKLMLMKANLQTGDGTLSSLWHFPIDVFNKTRSYRIEMAFFNYNMID